MQAVDDVDFGERLVGALPQLVPGLVERHRVGAGIARLQPRERAEQAAGDADVGRLEADVVVVVGAAAVPLLALAVGEPADREQIGRTRTAGRRRRESRRSPASSLSAMSRRPAAARRRMHLIIWIIWSSGHRFGQLHDQIDQMTR